MAKRDKLLARLRESSVGWRYAELKHILELYGFTTTSKGGSHRVFKHPTGLRVVLVEHGAGTLLPDYAREVRTVIAILIAREKP